ATATIRLLRAAGRCRRSLSASFLGQGLDKVGGKRRSKALQTEAKERDRTGEFRMPNGWRPSGSQDNAQRRWPQRLSTDGAKGKWLRGQDVNLRRTGYEGDFTQPENARD